MEIARTRRIDAAPDVIWKAISPVSSIPHWVTVVDAAEYVSGPEEGLGRVQKLRIVSPKGIVEEEQEVVGWEPARRLEVLRRRASRDGLELLGVSNYRTAVSFEPANRGTRVRVSYSWDAQSGMTWLLTKLFGGRVAGRELRDTLRKIARLVKEGPPKDETEER